MSPNTQNEIVEESSYITSVDFTGFKVFEKIWELTLPDFNT